MTVVGFLFALAFLALAWRIYDRLKGQKSPLIIKVESDMSQAFKDAFAAYQAFRDKQEADAVAAAKAELQPQIDAAHQAGVDAESAEDVQTVQAAMPAPQG